MKLVQLPSTRVASRCGVISRKSYYNTEETYSHKCTAPAIAEINGRVPLCYDHANTYFGSTREARLAEDTEVVS